MLLKQKVFAVAAGLLLMVFIFELVRRKKMREEYSWLWLLTGVAIIIMVLWYDLLEFITGLIGAVLPTTTLFILSILFLVLISIHFSVRISSLTDKMIKLTQELSILKAEKDRDNEL